MPFFKQYVRLNGMDSLNSFSYANKQDPNDPKIKNSADEGEESEGTESEDDNKQPERKE